MSEFEKLKMELMLLQDRINSGNFSETETEEILRYTENLLHTLHNRTDYSNPHTKGMFNSGCALCGS